MTHLDLFLLIQVGTLKTSLQEAVSTRFFGTRPGRTGNHNIMIDPVYTTPTLLHPKNRKIYQRFCSQADLEVAKANLAKECVKLCGHDDDDAHSISSIGIYTLLVLSLLLCFFTPFSTSTSTSPSSPFLFLSDSPKKGQSQGAISMYAYKIWLFCFKFLIVSNQTFLRGGHYIQR